MDGVHISANTPTKFSSKTGYVFCGYEEKDPRKKSKVSD